MRKLVTVAAAGLAAGALAAGAGAGSASVKVTLKEFELVPVPASVRAGKVTFVARNTGALTHELVVIRTTRAPAKLPVSGGKASEKGRVGESGDVKPGTTRKVTLTLEPGRYVLICNVAGHYQAGQRAAFVVR